jgi:trigger factor
MNITKENLDELNAVLKVKVGKEDYDEKVNNVLKDYRKKAKIDGFRPGKVPLGLINKMYRKPVLADEINKLVSESISKYLLEEKLNVLGEPLPHEEEKPSIDWDNDTEFEFAFDLGLAPDLEFSVSNKDKVPFYRIKIDEELRNKYIDNYTSRLGSFKTVDEVVENEMIKADIVQLNEGGDVKENGISAADASISVEMVKDDKIKKQFIGTKVGDIVNVDLKKAFPSDAELTSMLKIEKEQVKEVTGVFQVTIKSISKYEKAEINQELWDKLYGEGQVKTKEEFTKKIDEEIRINLERDSEYRFRLDIKDALVKKFKKALPKEFLIRWLLEVNEGKFTREDIEKDYDHFEEDLKWQLIRDKFIQENEIKVSDEEVLDTAKEFTRAQFMQYGLSNVPDEQLEAYARESLKREKDRKSLYEKKYEDKVVELLKEMVKLDEKEISSEKFDKLFEK